jgi:hypothetical protein
MRSLFRIRLLATRITTMDDDGNQALEALADLAGGQLQSLGALLPLADDGPKDTCTSSPDISDQGRLL